MSWIDKTSSQGPQWIQSGETQQTSNNGKVQALRDPVNKIPSVKSRRTPKGQSIHARGVQLVPPLPNKLNQTSPKPAAPIASTPPHAASIQKATRLLLDHHLSKISDAPDKQAQYRELIATFKPSTCVEGDDEFSEIQSALKSAAKELGSPGIADNPDITKALQKHFYRRLVTEGAALLKSKTAGATVKEVPPKPPVRTSSLPGHTPPVEKNRLEKNRQPTGVQKTQVSPPEEKTAATLENSPSKPESETASFSPAKTESEPTPQVREITPPGKRRKKKRLALDAPAKYMSKSLTQQKKTPWKEQMPTFFTRYLRAIALTGASEKANIDKQWYSHEVPGNAFPNKNSNTQAELRHRLEDIAFQEGNFLTGFYRFFDQHQLGRNVRMTAVSQMLLPLSEHGRIDPMTLQDLEQNSGTAVSQWLNQQLDDITRKEYNHYTALLNELKDTTENTYGVDLEATPYGDVPLEEITAATHGEGVFHVARVNSFQYTLDHCAPWLQSAHPVTDQFAELRLRDTIGNSSQKLTASQLENLNNQAKTLLNEISQVNMNKVPRSVQAIIATEKQSLEKIVEKYQSLTK